MHVLRFELIAQENQIPVENLITPEHVRRICWKPPVGATTTLVDFRG
jgi:ribonuclease D